MDFFPGIDFFIVCRCKPIGLNWKLYLDVSGSTPSQAIREPKRPEFQPESGFPADLIFSKPNRVAVNSRKTLNYMKPETKPHERK
jgi:hypothetical protein